MIQRIPLNALQEAVYSALSSSSYLDDVKVYDDVDKNADYPYITFGDSECSPNGSKLDDITDNTLTIEIWSKSRGKKEVNKIADKILYVLTAQPLNVAGFHVIKTEMRSFSNGWDESGTYWGEFVLSAKLQLSPDYQGV